MEKQLSHINIDGAAHMVDVSEKTATRRRAVVEGYVLMAPSTLETLKKKAGPKGEVLSVARIAGIQAAKRTGELIPLCHPLPVEQVSLDFEIGTSEEDPTAMAGVRIVATAIITAKTGVEMEAYTAVAVAALTIIDMLKAIDPAMEITGIRLLEKTGGKSDYHTD